MKLSIITSLTCDRDDETLDVLLPVFSLAVMLFSSSDDSSHMVAQGLLDMVGGGK